MNGTMADPNDPRPAPDNPNPEPARPPFPPETPEPADLPGIPSPTPDPIPSPGEEPVQIPPGSPPEIPTQPGFPAPTAARAVAIAVASLLLCVGSANMALAQTSDGTGNSATPADPCRVEPQDQNDDGQNGGYGNDETADPDDSAERPSLEDCNGVLAPPTVGDGEIVEPAPDTGTMPVIPPGTVPQQSADPDAQ